MRFVFFCMLAIRFYWNDNQRIELVNWCIPIFVFVCFFFRFSILFSRFVIAPVQFCCSLLLLLFSLLFFFENNNFRRRELISQWVESSRAEPSRVESMQREHAIQCKIKVIHATVSSQMCLQWNDLPKMYGKRTHELYVANVRVSSPYNKFIYAHFLTLFFYFAHSHLCTCMYKLWFIGTVFLFVT